MIDNCEFWHITWKKFKYLNDIAKTKLFLFPSSYLWE